MTKQSYIGIVAILIVLIGLYAFITLRNPAGTPNPNPDLTSSPNNSQMKGDSEVTPSEMNRQWSTILADVDAPPLGNPAAKYTLIEIGDFQCPLCGHARPIIEHMVKNSKGNLKVYFLNFPLVNRHPHAMIAAIAGLAAAKQGKFWQMYDILYSHQDELIDSEIEFFAQQGIPGLDLKKFEADIASPSLKARIAQQVAEADLLKVNATPSFLLRATSGGTPVCYCGVGKMAGSQTISDLAAKPPWLTGH